MKSDEGARALIVGGGFSGTIAAAELARRGIASVIVEGASRAGRGTAFSTDEAVHLLNVPAAKMSGWADAPDDFVEAIAGDGYGPDDFVPRRRFGAYLSAILDEARASGLVEIVEGQAAAADRDGAGWRVTLDDGRALSGAALILAQGNQPPEPLRVAQDLPETLFVNDPWSDAGRAAVLGAAARGGDVLIIGTGLTMVDVVLSLDSAGHRGRIVALSRRGLMPRGHAPGETVTVSADEVPAGSLMALWRWLRGRAGGGNWRGAVDSLRPHSHMLWRALPVDQQRRFLRHARPWWDVHRHRIAPQVSAQLKAMIGEGRLELVAGRIKGMRAAGDGIAVEIARRRSTNDPLGQRFAVAFNCTGPLGAIGRTKDALLAQLIGHQAVAADALGIGLASDARHRAGERIWALGPLTKGGYWEIVAVPDIRGQAAQVAEDVAKEISS